DIFKRMPLTGVQKSMPFGLINSLIASERLEEAEVEIQKVAEFNTFWSGVTAEALLLQLERARTGTFDVEAVEDYIERVKAVANDSDKLSVAIWLLWNPEDWGNLKDAPYWLNKAYEERNVSLIYKSSIPFSENIPDHPEIQAALDKPELNALFEIRRKNLHKRSM
ncbi:MAG: hypothetical protein MI725_11755, partial [Pirellulales bacterium]|nr:hypothetical protein [Pirellulales bacterium]